MNFLRKTIVLPLAIVLLGFRTTSVHPQGNYLRSLGFPVRCVASVP